MHTLTKSLRNIGLATVVLTLTLLAGCGFQLRGNVDIAEPITNLKLTGKTRGPIIEQIKRSFTLYDINVADITDSTAYELAFIEVKEDERSVGYDAQARTSEYELTMVVEFTLLNNEGLTLIPPRKVYAEKIYYNNPDNVIASDNEKELLLRDLRTQLAVSIVNQLATIDDQRLLELQAQAEEQQQQNPTPPAATSDSSFFDQP
ncbi:LPS-assembly lipoprotein LptE [Sinobacterium norvegicum]|uniref:LPS-assembly lipoprotein LptE n=1 Tax=Sinobacterium norvegicum TaxID=1641715 RepID=A0ABM9AEU5_9GAMM|nr:LPS assembly lipoprotein LptE [Sinobacterium norvegicum]CAH0991637.1 LPS-assembly lipoprotein LptE [Sinobacterium norvegicum]